MELETKTESSVKYTDYIELCSENYYILVYHTFEVKMYEIVPPSSVILLLILFLSLNGRDVAIKSTTNCKPLKTSILIELPRSQGLLGIFENWDQDSLRGFT